jgi:hypothetical protein
MQMPYITTSTNQYGRTERTMDMPRFSADLAKELGGKVLAHDIDRHSIQIGADLVHLYFNSWKGHVHVSITAPDVLAGDYSTYDKAQKTADANVNPDGRKIASIAKDIKRRVIDASQSALAARRAHAEAQQKNRASIVKHADALKAACPTLDIRVNEREQRAAIYSGPSNYYLSATMMSDGKVSIERIGAISVRTFRKLIAALEADKSE